MPRNIYAPLRQPRKRQNLTIEQMVRQFGERSTMVILAGISATHSEFELMDLKGNIHEYRLVNELEVKSCDVILL
jgi:hypothetical protein